MYNRPYKHVNEKEILSKKQFGFQQKHSTEHAILLLIDLVNCNIEKINLLQVFFLTFQKLLIQLIIKS